jgi:hypothetical protein
VADLAANEKLAPVQWAARQRRSTALAIDCMAYADPASGA